MSETVLINNWLNSKLANDGLSEVTVRRYGKELAKIQAWSPEGLIQDLTPGQLMEYSGIHLHKLGISPRSRRVAIAALKGFYGWLSFEEHVERNPAVELVYPKTPDNLPVAMSLKHTELLLMQPDIGTFQGIRDAAILALLAGCGFRVGGIVPLNLSNLVWFEYKEQSRLALVVTEKGRKQRSVPVPYEAMMLLQLYLKHEELESIDRLLPDGDEVLFVSLVNTSIPPDQYRGENRRLQKRSIQTMMRKHAEAAGIPEQYRHPHALRHQIGREMVESEVPLLVQQMIMGHADPKSTQIYTSIAMGKMSEAIDKGNPLGKIRTPLTDLIHELKQAGHLT